MDKSRKILKKHGIHKRPGRHKSRAAAALLVFMLVAATPVWATTADTTATQMAQALSKDNSLKSLSLSEGTLSPEFQSSTVNYTAMVGADVNSVQVNAELSNSNAVIDSITGGTDLQPGENTIKITVTSQAGTTAVYTIVVTKSEDALGATDGATQGDGIDGQETPSAVINADGTVTVDGRTYPVQENRMESQNTEGQLYPKATYEALEKKYESLKQKFMISMAAAGIVLVVLLIALVMTKRRTRDADDDFDDWDMGLAEEKKKRVVKKEPEKTVKKEPKKKTATPAKQAPEKTKKHSWEDDLDWEDEDDWDDTPVFRKKAAKEPARKAAKEPVRKAAKEPVRKAAKEPVRKTAASSQEKAPVTKRTSQDRMDVQPVKKTSPGHAKGQTGRIDPPAGHNDGYTKQTAAKKEPDEEIYRQKNETDVEIMDLNDL